MYFKVRKYVPNQIYKAMAIGANSDCSLLIEHKFDALQSSVAALRPNDST